MAERAPRLARLLGADRYLRLQYQLEKHMGAAALLAVAVVTAMGVGLYWLGRPLPNQHDGYLTANVRGSHTAPRDDGPPTYVFSVALPDGTGATVTTRSLAQATAVVGTACLERRIDTEGQPLYRLASPERCQ